MIMTYGIIDPQTGETPKNLKPGRYPLVLTALTLDVPENPHNEPRIVMIMELVDESNMPSDEDDEGTNSNGDVPH